MAKKQPAKKKKPTKSRPAVRKALRKPARQNPRKGAKVVAKKTSTRASRSAAPSLGSSKPAANVQTTVNSTVSTPHQENGHSLGRPKITADADLDLFFKDDYHARQIFKFLNVQTVKDLERYTANEILRRLSNPIKETVERIRRSLAHHNRCLTGDEEYAVAHKDDAVLAAKGG
jgi:hypothetical protein